MTYLAAKSIPNPSLDVRQLGRAIKKRVSLKQPQKKKQNPKKNQKSEINGQKSEIDGHTFEEKVTKKA